MLRHIKCLHVVNAAHLTAFFSILASLEKHSWSFVPFDFFASFYSSYNKLFTSKFWYSFSAKIPVWTFNSNSKHMILLFSSVYARYVAPLKFVPCNTKIPSNFYDFTLHQCCDTCNSTKYNEWKSHMIDTWKSHEPHLHKACIVII